RRHVRGDGVRHLPDPGVLLRHPGAQRDPFVRGSADPLDRFRTAWRVPGGGGGAAARSGRGRARALGAALLRSGGGPPCYRRHGAAPPSVEIRAFSPEGTMISHFFIDRPIFASVLSIVLVLAGVVAWRTLPVEQYPNVTPPTVQVTALYPGANALTVRDTVAAPIEQQVSGVEGMMYMSSQST